MNRTVGAIAFSFAAMLATTAAASNIKLAVPDNYQQNVFARELINSKALKEAGIQVDATLNLNEEQILSAVLGGSVEVGLTTLDAISNHKFENQPALASLFTHPFLFDSTQDLLDVQNSTLGEAVLVDISRTRLIPLAYWNIGSENLITRMPIFSPKDLAGLSIAVPKALPSTTMLTKLGALRKTLPSNGVYNSIFGGTTNATVSHEVPSEFSRQAVSFYVAELRPIVGVIFANADYWRSLSERQKIEWRYAIGNATKYALEDIQRQAANTRAHANFRKLGFAVEQKTEILRALFPNNPAIIEQAKLVQETLDRIHSQKLKKKTETKRPLIYPNPSSIIFVTDRNDEGGQNLSSRFGTKRNRVWHPICGDLKVGIDLNREFGQDYHGTISLSRPPLLGLKDCFNLISSRVQSERVFIFVHGFKNSFEDAIRRAAAMAFDYYFNGPIIVWAWPSDGRAPSYPFDEDSSRWTSPHFAEFLKYFRHKLPNVHLNLFAHSMGARILLAGLHEARNDRLKIDSIIFAAPDEARDIFEQSVSKIGEIARLQTLYGSENDRALYVSRYYHSPHGRRISRAGDGGNSILIIDGIESIDTSDLPTDLIGHSYVFENLETVDDIKIVITDQQPARDRGLVERVHESKRYWAIIP